MDAPLLRPPRLEAGLHLDDGRVIGLAEYGPHDGYPIFWFHGTPGGRRQIPPLARTLSDDLDLRLIAIERPGTGSSTHHRYSSFLAFTDDMAEITEKLGVDRFGIVALSGGGPYALACGAHLTDRVDAIVTLGGVAPVRGQDANDGGIIAATAGLRPMLRIAEPVLAKLIWGLIQAARPFKEQAMDAFAGFMPEGDQAVFARPEMREMFFDDMLRASSKQIVAPLLDALLFQQPWSFTLSDVRVPVLLVHGDADIIVPLHHADAMAGALPDVRYEIRPGESHLGGLDLAREAFDFILGHRRP